jgi:hypothetical protein
MPINPKTLEQIELDLETARGVFAAAQLNPAVDEATKLLAAAVAQAGSSIAIALATGQKLDS